MSISMDRNIVGKNNQSDFSDNSPRSEISD